MAPMGVLDPPEDPPVDGSGSGVIGGGVNDDLTRPGPLHAPALTSKALKIPAVVELVYVTILAPHTVEDMAAENGGTFPDTVTYWSFGDLLGLIEYKIVDPSEAYYLINTQCCE